MRKILIVAGWNGSAASLAGHADASPLPEAGAFGKVGGLLPPARASGRLQAHGPLDAPPPLASGASPP